MVEIVDVKKTTNWSVMDEIIRPSLEEVKSMDEAVQVASRAVGVAFTAKLKESNISPTGNKAMDLVSVGFASELDSMIVRFRGEYFFANIDTKRLEKAGNGSLDFFTFKRTDKYIGDALFLQPRDKDGNRILN